MAKNHVMLDLETLGTEAGCVVVAIGAVAFDPMGAYVHPPDMTNLQSDEFYAVIDIQSCLDAGLRINGNTLYWWLQQSPDARRHVTE
jgi:Mesyanzhinovviridae exonuclease